MQMLWKDIIGFEDSYQISNTGSIRTKDRYIGKRFYSSIIKTIHEGNHGYLQVNLKVTNKSNTKLIHRLVVIHFIDNPENKPEVNHKDGNKLNNNDWNLEWSTVSENSIHAYKLNLKVSHFKPQIGINNSNSKLNQEIADEIRLIYSKGNTSQRKLALLYNVSQPTIGNIINNLIWKI